MPKLNNSGSRGGKRSCEATKLVQPFCELHSGDQSGGRAPDAVSI